MPSHPPAVVVVDDALTLRVAVVADADEIARVIGLSLEHLTPWMAWARPEAADPEHQRARLHDARPDDGEDYQYLVLAEGELVGSAGLHRRVGPGAIEIGYWLAPFATGRGYATRTARALTAVGRDQPGGARGEIHSDHANARSAAVPERLGYRLDRVEPDEVVAPNEVGLSMVWVRGRAD
jgi:RimJ/RimL family protein N-acetyltransferase